MAFAQFHARTASRPHFLRTGRPRILADTRTGASATFIMCLLLPFALLSDHFGRRKMETAVIYCIHKAVCPLTTITLDISCVEGS